jgi:hypothetical protein
VRAQAQLCRIEDAAGRLGEACGAPTSRLGCRDGDCVPREWLLAKVDAHRWEPEHETTLISLTRHRVTPVRCDEFDPAEPANTRGQHGSFF